MKIDKLIFKILHYLYAVSDLAMPSMEPISHQALKVPLEVWNNAVAMLYEEGYIKGVIVKNSKTGYYVLNEDEMKITMKGIDYYKNNTGFKKFLEAANGIAPLIPKI